jgi:DNA repair protein RadA/Sms
MAGQLKGRPLTKAIFVCQQCGFQTGKWHGRCPSCDAWDSLVEEVGAPARRVTSSREADVIPYPDVENADLLRTSTGQSEFDRVLGGGLVPGGVVLVGGEPGVGKSTLLLQTASALANSGRRVLYASGEESPAQLRLRGERLAVSSPNLLILADTDVDAIAEAARRSRADVLLVDSIQAVRCAELTSVPGSVGQVRESAARLVALAKSSGLPVVLVGHVTKDGAIAGPRTLEHVVDTVIQFEGDRHHAHRILRALKNRFGPSDEIGVFSMGDAGLVGVGNPSEIFLAERARGCPGSAVLAAIEGLRPLLVEVQALVGEAAHGSPRRVALGVDASRVAMILAVLARRAGIDVAGRDVFVNIAGGLETTEPAADLAVALAAASSLTGRALPERMTILGEIGLAGEIRNVARLDARLREAGRLGFDTALVPAGSAAASSSEVRVRPVRHLAEALEAAAVA